MAIIATDLSRIGIKKATTWNTAVAVTSGILVYGRVQQSGGLTRIFPDDIGWAGKQQTSTFTSLTYNLTITCDLAYGQGLNALIGAVMGTEATSAEITVGQGDYRHDIDLANDPSIFYSVCWLTEDDKLVEVPSFKPIGFTIQQDINGKGTVTIRGIGDRALESGTTSSVANLNSLTAPTGYQLSTFGGVNHYCRMNADGGAGLTNTDDKQVMSYSLSIDRASQGIFVLRGANTIYVTEPRMLGDITGKLTLTLGQLDDAQIDMFSLWRLGTTQKAEIFVDGAQIGTGSNKSYKFQMPYLKCDGTIPTAYSPEAKNQYFQPSITFDMLKRSAAPTGMTGVTDYFRHVSIDQRTTSWTA